MAEKRCSKCGEVKPATTEFFHKHPEGKFGLRPDCKTCFSARTKRYAELNKEQIRAQRKQFRIANKEKIAAANKAHYEANKERIIARVPQAELGQVPSQMPRVASGASRAGAGLGAEPQGQSEGVARVTFAARHPFPSTAAER